MRYVLLFLLISSAAFAQQKTRKNVFIILDGIPADVLEKVETPNMDEISVKGSYTRAYVGGEKGGESESPTISAVGYNSLLTGTWANKHNVWGNSIENPNYEYWSVFRIMRNARTDAKLGIYSTWEDNRTKLIGEGKAETDNLKIDVVFDGYELDTVNFPHDEAREYIHKIDELVVSEAAKSIEKDAPDLSWIYLEFTDDMGHKFGDSPEMYEAVKLADRQIGEVYDAIKKREQNHNEEWLIVITTDHGRDAETGKNHGGQSDRERTTWIVSSKPIISKKRPLAIVDIMPSICEFMGVKIPEKVEEELDGESFFE
ncbi:MAG: putative AlkP superfamily pyrophosphatase or phosphodiesterase [Spirosomataceae bacterium]|jgi:predicted AlkP superfamily pyrophosphatase or phosphodiesterase